MTLIACLMPHGHPCLVGDVVVSAGVPPVEPVRLPTVGDSSTTPRSDSQVFITDLKQKLIIIAPNLAIAWSGKLKLVDDVVTRLKNLMSISSTPDIDLELFMRNYGYSETAEDLSIIGILYHNNEFSVFGSGTETYKSNKFGDVSFAGSGTNTMISTVKDLERYELPEPGENVVGSIVLPVQSLIDDLIYSEANTASSLGEYFGGAYEIITWIDGQFRKIQPKTTLFSEMILAKKNYRARPRIILKQDYVGDLLRIYSIDYRKNPVLRRVQLVAPYNKSEQSYSPSLLDTLRLPPKTLESDWLSVFVEITSDFSEATAKITDASCAFNMAHKVTISGSIQNVDVTFHPNFASHLSATYMQHIANLDRNNETFSASSYIVEFSDDKQD